MSYANIDRGLRQLGMTTGRSSSQQEETSSKKIVKPMGKSRTAKKINAEKKERQTDVSESSKPIKDKASFRWNMSKVRSALNLDYESSKDLKIVGESDHLVQINYKDNGKEPTPLVSALRGSVIDTKTGMLISRGSTYTYTGIIDESKDFMSYRDDTTICNAKIPKDHEDGGYTSLPLFDDCDTIEQDVTETNIAISNALRSGKFFARYYSQGTVLHFFLSYGRVYVATHKNLNADTTRSAYGGTKPFYESYVEIGGPKKKRLFPSGVMHSPYVYRFLVTTPKSTSGTRAVFGKKGYLTFLGVNKLWELGSKKCMYTDNPDYGDLYVGSYTDDAGIVHIGDDRTKEQVLNIQSMCDIPVVNTFPNCSKKPFIYYPMKSLSTEEIAYMLKYGLKPTEEYLNPETLERYERINDTNISTNPKHSFGDCVIVSWQEMDPKIGIYTKTIKIYGQGYKYRSTVMEKEVDPRNKLFTYMDNMSKSAPPRILPMLLPPVIDDLDNNRYEFVRYDKALSLLSNGNSVSSVGLFMPYINESFTSIDYSKYVSTKNPKLKLFEKEYSILTSFISLCPVVRIEEFLSYWDEYIIETTKLSKWLVEFASESNIQDIDSPYKLVVNTVVDQIKKNVSKHMKVPENFGKDPTQFYKQEVFIVLNKLRYMDRRNLIRGMIEYKEDKVFISGKTKKKDLTQGLNIRDTRGKLTAGYEPQQPTRGTKKRSVKPGVLTM